MYEADHKILQKKLFHKWKTWWTVRKSFWKKIKTLKSTHKILKLHKKLFKIWSFITVQLWLDKTELTVFMHKKKCWAFSSSTAFVSEAERYQSML